MENIMINQIIDRVYDALETCEIVDSGLQENHLYIREDGSFDTTCRNEYGGNYGTIREGRIDLSEEETALLESYGTLSMSL